MRGGFTLTGGGNANECGVLPRFQDGARPGVTHPGTQPPDQLVKDIARCRPSIPSSLRFRQRSGAIRDETRRRGPGNCSVQFRQAACPGLPGSNARAPMESDDLSSVRGVHVGAEPRLRLPCWPEQAHGRMRKAEKNCPPPSSLACRRREERAALAAEIASSRKKAEKHPSGRMPEIRLLARRPARQTLRPD